MENKEPSHRTIMERKEQIIGRWEHLVRDCIRAARNAPEHFIRDHIPKFITELSEALDPKMNKDTAGEDNDVAAIHGRQRKATSLYKSENIILEYYLLKIAIIEVICRRHELSRRDHDVISRSIEEAIGESLEAFAPTAT